MKPEVMRHVEERFHNDMKSITCMLRGHSFSQAESLRMLSHINETIMIIKHSTKNTPEISYGKQSTRV